MEDKRIGGLQDMRSGKLCIEVTPESRIAFLSESLCIGCGICTKKCPFGAINIINLPTNLDSQVTHRYSANSFKLHRLPTPRPGQVLGLVGTNGIGKSTALKILSGKLKPNLGKYDNPPDWEDVIKYFRGSELQNYFTKLLEDDLKAVVKPQYVDQIPKAIRGPNKSVQFLIESRTSLDNLDEVLDTLELRHIYDRDVSLLSGGELQRFAIGTVCVQNADVYMFDEPSSYLDVKQRLSAARIIRSLLRSDDYVIVVEHDLSVLDYLSDYICVLYGQPAVYGVVTLPHSVREGINIFLDGHIPTENLRFRNESLTFKLSEGADEFIADRSRAFHYPKMEKTMGNFKLQIDSGDFTDSEILVLMGENGTGKTTFCRLLAGALKPDGTSRVPEMKISMKPQTITPKFDGTVRQLFFKKIRPAFLSPQFQTDVVKPLKLDDFIDQEVKNLSGGELQRVAIVLALGLPADIYLIDEPSAYLDSEQRIIAARVIKRFIMHAKKTAFIVEHDFIMATYLADRVIVFDGQPGINAHANSPESLLTGCNTFLKNLDVTFRRDPTNYRPRINKSNSQLDQEQKAAGNYQSVMKGALKGSFNERVHVQTVLSRWTVRPSSQASEPTHDPRRGVSHETDSGAEDDCNRDNDNMTTGSSMAFATTANGTRHGGNDDNDQGGDDDEPEG
ncbi:ATP-binding protein cassette, sub-family E, member 1 [Sporothrix brasiliensis 5110]|uniref:Translation initiation factor RLI1 n=1 Tax=Sporothrix brasiliensis 5110 TaxID=1398154 RepID=A0A0C2F9B5_9PEZI|nr:ATP-binding protein cassette, sub-family E, member 1 [Sporothrix brasiliensis 5110]KIH87643.1 ATP-binding protein cassette, sub-family E, member 1 [Sporothrix brasiliensis 5110]